MVDVIGIEPTTVLRSRRKRNAPRDSSPKRKKTTLTRGLRLNGGHDRDRTDDLLRSHRKRNAPRDSSPKRKKTTLTRGLWLNGGRDRDRTDDLLVANEALSQLSYTPKKSVFMFWVYF